MKYRIIALAVIVFILLSAFFLQNIDIKKNRYHQHLQAVEKGECTDHGEEEFCTHLPLLSITTDEAIPSPYVVDTSSNLRVHNNDTVGATIRLFDAHEENNHLTDVPDIEERGTVRVRGASSREYDKKGYLIKFKEDDLQTGKKVSVCGMTPDSEWALHGPFLDKTLIRNYICYNLAGEIMDYAPNVRFCEAFINGEYMGVYLIVEKPEYNRNGRIQIEQTNPKMDATSYIVQIDRMPDDPNRAIETYLSYSLISKSNDRERRGYYSVAYPSITLTDAQKQFIETDISTFERALFSYDFNDKHKGYKEYIDVDSFVDYFLINEFTLNYDAVGLSTFLYRYRG